MRTKKSDGPDNDYAHPISGTWYFSNTPNTTVQNYPRHSSPIDVFEESRYFWASVAWQIQPLIKNTKPTIWLDYISRLPDWDHNLIKDNIQIWETILLEASRDGALLYLCSNGGAVASMGSYAAVIATEKQIVITIKGRAHKLRPISFRSEFYGVLAVLRYILHWVL